MFTIVKPSQVSLPIPQSVGFLHKDMAKLEFSGVHRHQ